MREPKQRRGRRGAWMPDQILIKLSSKCAASNHVSCKYKLHLPLVHFIRGPPLYKHIASPFPLTPGLLQLCA